MTLSLLSAAFTPIDSKPYDCQEDYLKRIGIISSVFHQQVDWVLESLSDNEKSSINRHFLCSTMLELPFTSGQITLDLFNQALHTREEKLRSIPVTAYINTYECASWGYTLRHYLNSASDQEYFLLSIIDANLLNLSFWQHNENWGQSGFGVTTLLLKREIGTQQENIADCAVTWNATPEFATVIRRHMKENDQLIMSLPFFPDNIRSIFVRMLGNYDQLPDLHDQWGHCFGSDPWVGIISAGLNNELESHKKLLACSVALNGYYCMSHVGIEPNSRFKIGEAV